MISTTTMTCSARGKRARAMVSNDPAPTTEQQTKRGLLVEAGTMVLYKAPHIDALTLKAMPPAGREEPPCLRKHYLVGLKLRADLPVHFLGERVLENSDICGQQNRLRLPGGNLCIDVLHKILSLEDLDSANLLHEIATRPRTKPPRQQSEPDNGTAYEEQGKSKKITGRPHGGLRVKLVDLFAGDKELLLSRWDSKNSVVIKGEGYVDFIRKCSFNKHDVVEVWAFKQRSFYNFGKMLCHDSLLHVLIIKKDQQPHCKYCDCHLPQ